MGILGRSAAIGKTFGNETIFDSKDKNSLAPRQDSLKSKVISQAQSKVAPINSALDSDANVQEMALASASDRLVGKVFSLLSSNDAASASSAVTGAPSLQAFLQNFIRLQRISSFSAGTPGSEILFARSTDRFQQLVGRNGEDTLIAFDPDNTTSEDFAYHVLLGDNQEADPTFSKDTFVLGDWRRPYYNDANYDILGLKQVAQIQDFQVELDKIQLYGSANNYYLREVPPTSSTAGGTAIFQVSKQGLDLIAIVSGVFGLDIRGDYFQYEGTTAPAAATDELAKIGQLGSPALDYVSDIAWNSNAGNLLISGFSSGNLGSTTPPQDTPGNADIFFANYDTSGNLLGLNQFGSSDFEFDSVTSIATDNQGNLYIAGISDGNLAGRNQTGPIEGIEDVIVVKYNSAGQLQWAQQFGTSGTDAPFSIDVDPNGEFFYLSGLQVTYPQEQGQQPMDDAWVGKYDATNGQQVWFNTFGTEGAFDESYGVGVDSAGNVFATGFTRGDLGGTNQGAYDIWITKFAPDGVQGDIVQFGGAGHEFPWDLELDSQGNVYVTGWTESDLDGALNGAADYFVAKYDNDLNQVWVKQFGSSGYDGTYGLYIDANDDLYVSGYTNGALEEANAGSYDAFAAKFDSDGTELWTQQFGTTKDDQGARITGDNLGNLYVTGLTQGSFGALNAGSVDTWIAKLNASDGGILDFNPSATPEASVI